MSSELPSREELRAALNQQIRTVGALSVMLSQTVAERVGLNSTDMESLDLLFVNGPLTAGRLAELTGLTTGAITGIVDRLERAGHVRRETDPADRRRVIIHPLPEKANREIGPLYAPLATAMEALYDRYSDEELGIIVDFLGKSQDIAAAHIATLRADAPSSRNRVNPPAAGS